MAFSTLTLTLTLLAAALVLTTSSAQSTAYTPGCVSNLILCGNYLTTTAPPPQSCCGPLKIVVTTQVDCLCGLYNTPGLLQSFNINITQVLAFPERCGIYGFTLAPCSKVAGAPSPSPSRTPTGTSGKNENSAERMNGFMISTLVIMMSWIGILLW